MEERNPPENPETEGSAKHSKTVDVSEITAPSIGPHTVIDRQDPADRLAQHEQSTVDAMGKDKRRQVIGHSYGPSRRQQLIFFGIVAAVIVVLYGGSKILVAEYDQPPDVNTDAAPWSKPGAPQTPPQRPF